MRKRHLIPFLLTGLFAALCTLGCNDVLLERGNGLELSFVAPGSSSGSGRSADGADWNISAWLGLEDGTTLQDKTATAAAGALVSIAFDPVTVGTRLKVRVELVSAADYTVKYAGESDPIVVAEGENGVSLVVERVIVNAAAPVITSHPVGETKLADGVSSWTKELNVTATSPDGGNLTYQWYSNGSDSPETFTPITNATSASYTPDNLSAGDTRSFYCVVTNTNTKVNGTTTATATTNVAVLALLEGTLTSITASYLGSQGESYMLVDSFSFDGFSVTETYTVNGQSITKEVTSLDGQYRVEIPEKSIGNVPITIINSFDEGIKDEITVPIKYELNADHLTITGGSTVEQGNDLPLKAEYKVDGNDVQYKLYDESGSSTSYKVIEKAGISWTGAAQQSNKWEALAETNEAGSKTATVKLISTDGWCVTTEISNVFSYTVTGFLGSQTNPVLNWTDLRSLVESDNRQSPIYVSGTMDATETITVLDSVEIIAAASTTISRATSHVGLLFESAAALTFTGSSTAPIIFAGNNIDASSPMISADANLTMNYCTMQENVNASTSGGGAILVKEGILTLDHCAFTGNKATSSLGQGGALCIEGQTTKSQITSSSFTNNTAAYGGGAIIYNGDVSVGTDYTHTLSNCTFNGNSVSGGNGGGIYIFKGFVTINGITMSGNTNSGNKNQDILLYYESSLTLGDTVNIPSLYNNFSSEYPIMKVSQSFNTASSVGIVLSPTSGTAYPTSQQLFTLEDGVSVFNWVNNFTITGEDGSSYELDDSGFINKQ